MEKAYQLFLHATRLDLDDYNNEADQGLHITNMPGSWLAIVRGFAGMQVLKGDVVFLPCHTAKMGQLFIQGELSEKHTSHIRSKEKKSKSRLQQAAKWTYKSTDTHIRWNGDGIEN